MRQRVEVQSAAGWRNVVDHRQAADAILFHEEIYLTKDA